MLRTMKIFSAFIALCLVGLFPGVHSRPRNVDVKRMVLRTEASSQTDNSSVDKETRLENESSGRLENAQVVHGGLVLHVKGQRDAGELVPQLEFPEGHAPDDFNVPGRSFPNRQDKPSTNKAKPTAKSFYEGLQTSSKKQNLNTMENGLNDSDESIKIKPLQKDSVIKEHNSSQTASDVKETYSVDQSSNEPADKPERETQNRPGGDTGNGTTIPVKRQGHQALVWQKENDQHVPLKANRRTVGNRDGQDDRDLTRKNDVPHSLTVEDRGISDSARGISHDLHYPEKRNENNIVDNGNEHDVNDVVKMKADEVNDTADEVNDTADEVNDTAETNELLVNSPMSKNDLTDPVSTPSVSILKATTEDEMNSMYDSPAAHTENEENSMHDSPAAHTENAVNSMHDSPAAHTENEVNSIHDSPDAHTENEVNSIHDSPAAHTENEVNSIHDSPAADLADREPEEWEVHDDKEADTKDDCEISQLRCSPFFASPCETLNPDRGPEYGGHCQIRRHTAEKKWKPCGDLWTQNRSACFCSNHAAVCCANLSAIPDLSINNNKTILYLNFTSNNLTVLSKDLLSNFTQLRWLLLSRNNISTVFNDSLENMRHLERFELAYNQFNTTLRPFDFAEAVNRVHSLQVLDVNFTAFSKAKPREVGITWLIRHLNLPHLKQLFVDGGRKTKFYLSDLDPKRLPKLCKFSIKSHFVERIYCCSVVSRNDSLDYNDDEEHADNSGYPYVDDTINQFSCISLDSRNDTQCRHFQLPNMKLLNFANNSLVYAPHFCRPGSKKGERESVVPSLSHLLLAINAVINPRRYQFQCLDSLLFLALPGNPLKTIQSNIFQNMGKLQTVDLRFTNVMQVDSHAFNHSSLRHVTIKSSNWFMDQHHDACCISPDLFLGSSLDSVDLSYNVFRYADKNTTHYILSPLRTVRKLWMAEVGFFKIPRVVQQDFTNLEFLDFHANQMSEIAEDTFDNLTQLKYLDISGNYLANPNEEVLRKLIVERNIHVNLESNPFSCTCDMLPFLDLYKIHRDTRPPRLNRLLSALSNRSTSKGMFVGRNYRCYAPRPLFNHSLQHVHLTVHNCLLTFSQEIIIFVVCLLFIFFLLVYALLYKYRWQVRFWLYTLHVRLNRVPSAATAGGGGGHRPMSRPRFNAFVSYCKEDSHFVINKVLPTLERNSRLPLCIHERDFMPGRYISQNVVERMEESRHVLLVLSNAFLQNDWCRFELFVAQKYGLIYRQIPIIILLLEQLRVDLMDAHVITLLHASPGIVWPGNEGDARIQASFWNRLGQTLGSARAGHVAARRNPARVRCRSEGSPGAARGGGRHERRGSDEEHNDP